MKTKKKEYRAAHGCPYSHQDAQVIGQEMELLREMLGGELRPKDVLEYSKTPGSALHSYFDWDDKSAANKWRVEQAKRMIRYVYVVIEDDGEPREVRALVSVTSRTGGKRYVGVEKAMSDSNYRNQVIEEAMNKAQMWRNKYREYKELGKIFKSIDNWTK